VLSSLGTAIARGVCFVCSQDEVNINFFMRVSQRVNVCGVTGFFFNWFLLNFPRLRSRGPVFSLSLLPSSRFYIPFASIVFGGLGAQPWKSCKPLPITMSKSPDQPTDARARLLSHFQSAKGSSEHGQKWDDLWKEGFLPWDKGVPNPALVDLLSERQDLLPPPAKSGRRKALVPGCGKGYDVLLLSAFGYDAYGLDISSSALQEARKVEKEMGGKGVYETKEGAEKGSITWVAGDFFEDQFLKDVEGEGTFDLIYDYTV